MPLQLIQKEIEQILGVIKAHPEVEQAILFGSRAVGKARTNSDIDICLKGKNVSYRIHNAIAAELDELPLPYFFDVIDFATISNEKLISHIQHDGVDLLQLETTV